MIDVNNELLKDYNFVDLFCGIGGFHLALRSFGANCVFASEIDKKAKEIYYQNYKIEPKGDITKIKNEEIPKHDILCAGFPCQPFSISGQQLGFNDSRGKLFFEIIRIAKYRKPKIIFLENVKNLISHDNGKTIVIIRKELQNAGYFVYDKILSASKFGIPQSRDRLYIVALRKDLEIKKFEFPIGIENNCKLSDILYDESEKYDVIVKRPFTKNKEFSKRKGLIQVAKIGKGRQGERIYSPNGLSTTLSSQSGGLGGKTGLYLINNQVRKLYPRECARLMGFPDSFIYAEELPVVYKQFGNSVIVDVLQYILLNIINQIEGDKNE